MDITTIVYVIVSFCTILFSAYKGLEAINDRLHLFSTRKTDLDERLDKFDEKLDKVTQSLDKTIATTDALRDASISRIKQKIVERHELYMAKGSIDYRSLDCLQQQYKAYERMGGNSYVHELMSDLESLPISDV